jgi:uncharacterized protein
MANQIVWTDIPVVDLDRAIRFYSAVLGTPVTKQEIQGTTIALLPDAQTGSSGCLYHSDDNQPCASGPLVYLNCSSRLDEAAAAVEPNGGKIIKPKHSIAPFGSRAIVLDSEGNRIALHSS